MGNGGGEVRGQSCRNGEIHTGGRAQNKGTYREDLEFDQTGNRTEGKHGEQSYRDTEYKTRTRSDHQTLQNTAPRKGTYCSAMERNGTGNEKLVP